jgi:prepilin-type N-terminal cleavage/methylation domain-containing protein
MNYEQRNTNFEPRAASHKQRGFTLVELVVAIGIMALVILFAGTVFKSSINSYRIASAQAEIMQKLRAITQQLDSDFQGLQKDGYLILYSENLLNRTEYPGAPSGSFRSDRLYFFSTGDFQSWFDSNLKSNIARIYLGHEGLSLADPNITVNRWRLAHDANLLCPGVITPPIDVNNVSYAWYKANSSVVLTEADVMLIYPPNVNVASDSSTIRRLFCENAGQFKIEWADGSIDPNSAIAWFGLGNQKGIIIESGVAGSNYKAEWQPSISADLWPKALKFTFTLYDSRGVFKDGQTFTHIVYLGD